MFLQWPREGKYINVFVAPLALQYDSAMRDRDVRRGNVRDHTNIDMDDRPTLLRIFRQDKSHNIASVNCGLHGCSYSYIIASERGIVIGS